MRHGRCLPRSVLLVVFLIGCLAVGNRGFAQSEQAGEENNRGLWLFGSVETAYEQLREDGYLRLDARLALETGLPAVGCDDDEETCRTRFRAGLQAPVRLRLYDDDPQDPGVIRREDWDEISDVGRVIRRVEYGRTGEAVHAKVGELGPATLGHGTLMQAYYNVITPGSYQLGVTGRADLDVGGGELVVDNAFGPNVIGVRAFARPLVIAEEVGASEIDVADRWTTGVSVVTDVRAPYALSEPQETVIVGPERQPRTSESRATMLVGFDTEYRLVDRESWTLSPYADFNHHVQLGSGLHAGAMGVWEVASDVTLEAIGEFRLLGPRYLPSYIGPLYELTRFQMSGWGMSLPAPKLRVAAEESGGTRFGGYGEWRVHIADHSQATLGFEEYTGPDNGALRLHFQVAPNERFQIGGFYFNRALGDVGDVFELASSLLAVETRVQIIGPMYATGGYGHLWELEGDGTYSSIDRWMLGVGVSGALQ